MNNKELIPTLVLIFALFGGAYYYSDAVQSPISSLLNRTKTAYHDTLEGIHNFVEEHFSQQATIAAQRELIENYRKAQAASTLRAAELRRELAACGSEYAVNPKTERVRALSYAKFGDMRKVWLEMEDFNTSRVYGLIYNDLAAGIVVASRNQPMALLNGDPKSSYAVYVGPNRAPGIVHGSNADTLTVKYIPTWIKISVGDEVFTSGMDNLFFRGLRVGKIHAISLSQGYQNAVVTPYYNADDPGYFHVITAVR
jgi:rod shape-determining protein MreC